MVGGEEWTGTSVARGYIYICGPFLRKRNARVSVSRPSLRQGCNAESDRSLPSGCLQGGAPAVCARDILRTPLLKHSRASCGPAQSDLVGGGRRSVDCTAQERLRPAAGPSVPR